MTGESCRGELLDRARRGPLRHPDQLALDAHLTACASCRLSRDVAADFDDVDMVDVRDGVRLRNLSDAARRWTAGASRGGRRVERRVGERGLRPREPFAGGAGPSQGPAFKQRLRAIAVAASLVIFGGSASAAVWWWQRPERTVAPIVTATTVDHAAKLAVPAVTATVIPQPVAPARASTRARQVSRTRPVDEAAPDAAALLRAASAARRSREIDRAIALYRQLRRTFPGSPEAAVSAIPLGRLLLDAGASQAALAEFDAYLRESRGGPLVCEALYGRGRALAALGARPDERLTWERLLLDHPGSAYSPHARQRLMQLTTGP